MVINLRKILYGIFIWTIIAVIYSPIIVLVVFSFSETAFIDFGNFQFGFDLYRQLFANRAITEAIINTFVVAIVAALTATFIGTVACVGILAMKKRTRGFVMSLNQIPLINATIITSFSLMILFITLGIFNAGYIQLILSHTLLCLPVVALVVLPRLRSLDPNLFEAAQDLGARPVHALFSVVIPQLIPAMIVAFLLGFTFSLDDFIITQHNRGAGAVSTISTIAYSARNGPPAALRALSTLLFGVVVIVVIALNVGLWRRQRKLQKLQNR